MPCENRTTDHAREDFLGLEARGRSTVKATGKTHLERDQRFLERRAESREQARSGRFTNLAQLPDK